MEQNNPFSLEYLPYALNDMTEIISSYIMFGIKQGAIKVKDSFNKLHFLPNYIKKDNKDYFITKYNYVYEGMIIDRCNKIYIQIIDNTLNDKIFNDLLSIIDSSYTLEDIYNKLNYYANIKIIKSKLIDNKTNELITDKLVIKNNSLEDLKLTINNQEKKYIIEKNNDNYIVTYINSSLEDINKSYFTINNSTSFVKKLERKKSF